ncbi:Crp/Fnr family transcriptional regulator [Cytophagaceae bacterium DM2B3-1]|uniref:Crp/Fnr family transcriptional regulator n=1 Tax=Xanthocytophaga flava TaxID=3048013 RepID=A0ABT7CPC3_9BACT|nr:Crp/Fnr family transcriptional regulator [Xanthocytophaga flavus]MDJ1467329.1 Crp/Fnr family transcriptional regulator [Xanthocytophaga flavus]MDJ1494840.1 Crp/Fnr family transcriptional regulator [Xanthocytophaga flavus]
MEELAGIFDNLGLDKTCFETFVKLARTKTLKRQEHWITEGNVCRFIGFVVSGTLRSYVQNADGEFNNDFYLENNFVSAYTSFLTQMPTNCNIQALTEAQILYITYEQLATLTSEDIRFVKLGKYISDHFFIRKCKRETSFLKHTAAERFEMVKVLYPEIEQRVSQYHIASYLGIKPQSLSRIKLLTYVKK